MFEETSAQPGLVAVMLLVGAAILWLADRWGSRLHELAGCPFVSAFVIGAAQALALIPGVSRSASRSRRACSPGSSAKRRPVSAS